MSRVSSAFRSSMSSFKFWFGYGSPLFLLMTLATSYFYTDYYIFWGYIILSQVWWWESLLTTCRRCPNYGTSNCGVQGLMVEKLLPFSNELISKKRIQLHMFYDLLYVVISVIICWKFYATGVISTIWALGALYLTFIPKRYHGLLYQVK